MECRVNPGALGNVIKSNNINMDMCKTLTLIKRTMHTSKIHVALHLLTLCITSQLEGEKYKYFKVLVRARVS